MVPSRFSTYRKVRGPMLKMNSLRYISFDQRPTTGRNTKINTQAFHRFLPIHSRRKSFTEGDGFCHLISGVGREATVKWFSTEGSSPRQQCRGDPFSGPLTFGQDSPPQAAWAGASISAAGRLACTGICRGFSASGTSCLSAMCNSPFSSLAPLTTM